MQVKYGSYTHTNGEVALNVSRDTIFAPGEIPQSIRETWVLDGMLIPTGGSSVDSLVSGLTSAYSVDGKDIALYENGAVTRTNLYLLNSDCIGGTRVVQHPSFPESRNAAYITNLPYRIIVRGDRPIETAESLIISWRESVTRQGGGSSFAMVESLYDRPVRQRTRRHTIYRATQAGSAVGRYSYPAVPRSLWPFAQVGNPIIMQRGPDRRGSRQYENYEISWQYTFESEVPLLGGPTIY